MSFWALGPKSPPEKGIPKNISGYVTAQHPTLLTSNPETNTYIYNSNLQCYLKTVIQQGRVRNSNLQRYLNASIQHE